MDDGWMDGGWMDGRGWRYGWYVGDGGICK